MSTLAPALTVNGLYCQAGQMEVGAGKFASKNVVSVGSQRKESRDKNNTGRSTGRVSEPLRPPSRQWLLLTILHEPFGAVVRCYGFIH